MHGIHAEKRLDGGKLVRSLSNTYGCSGEAKLSTSPWPNQLKRKDAGEHLCQYWHLGKFFCSGIKSCHSCQSLPIPILRGALPHHCSKTLASAQRKSSSGSSSCPNCPGFTFHGHKLPQTGTEGAPSCSSLWWEESFCSCQEGDGAATRQGRNAGLPLNFDRNACSATGRKLL